MCESNKSGCTLNARFTFSCDHRKRYDDHTWDVFEQGVAMRRDIMGMTTTVWTANESWEVQDMGDDLDLDEREKELTDRMICTDCGYIDNVVCSAEWFASPVECRSAKASQRIAEKSIAIPRKFTAIGEALSESETTLRSLVYDIFEIRGGDGVSLPKELSWIPGPDGQLEPVTDITLGGKSICGVRWQKETTVDGTSQVLQRIQENIYYTDLLTKAFAQGHNVNDRKLSKQEIESALALCEQEEESVTDDE